MRLRSKKEKAFDTLSIQAKLHIKLEEATTDQEKFIQCIHYATDIAQRKSLSNVNEITNTNLKIIMQLIKSFLNSGVNPDSTENNVPAIFHAVTYPELVNLLLTRGANPNFQTNSQATALHRAAIFFHSFYVENLYTTAELLAAAGIDIDAKDDQGKKPIELIKETLLLSEEEIGDIETRFKQVTEHPREINEIPIQLVEESPYSYLLLTEADNVKIALYNEKKYDELIKSDPIYQTIYSLFPINRTSPETDFNRSPSTELLF